MEQAAQAPEWAAALEATWAGVLMRQSAVAYPVANLVHLLGLTLLVGPILLFDLRVLGVGRRLVGLEGLSQFVTPFAVAGAILAIASGPLLFLADAKALSTSPTMIAKLALVALGLLNALAFRRAYGDRLVGWDSAPAARGRAQAAASIVIWFTVAGLGRMIAYL
ncbi:DUF6644 family protein [Chenggangzhangella methanolivorans]|uniref:DUF6644 domain-containing protein n=1 Tax=Chenggangzhangella methanolivorans TaxID=1437009 RepID=A0A9E6REL1_9HYPH|nr:DUF6644 family protein [Chenggangzhangella methanolivorans]QZN99481.1 hypothetical protein K6K41_22650 [Chenggangzhangella methanolivorans]